MTQGKPLPANLVQRYADWKATKFVKNKALYQQLAEEGQHPQAMVISCCDSRVHATAFFGDDPGAFFIHRNIANLVPPYKTDGDQHGTSAAIEYAVSVLKVAHIIILGHSGCGGVYGCYQMCNGDAPDLEQKSSFVGRWVDILRPGYERVAGKGSTEEQIAALEREGILLSMENLMGFPFVRDAVTADTLSIHGMWTNIVDGSLFHFDGTAFVPVAEKG